MDAAGMQTQGFRINSKSESTPSSPTRSAYSFPYPTAPSSPSAAAIKDRDDGEDFAFDFGCHLNGREAFPELTAADELFFQGKILPLKSPLHPCPDFFPGGARGRGRVSSLASRSRKGSRSLSPLRGEASSSSSSSSSNNNNSKKWCFKDLLLFRSASEGRATGDRDKDPLRKYTAACCSGDESRSSSSRWMSPHEMHYAANRAAAEGMRRKTALPYKGSVFSWLKFAPALRAFAGHSPQRSKTIAGPKSVRAD